MIPHLSLNESAPWAITPEGLARARDAVSKLNAERNILTAPAAGWREAIKAEADAQNGHYRRGPVLVQPVKGVMSWGADPVWEYCCGMFNTERIIQAMRVAQNDSTVEAVVFDYDTPGGSSMGVLEAAQSIADYRANTAKKVVSYVGVQACSAGYWTAAAANEIQAAPIAVLGSIGTYMVTMDWSEYFRSSGILVRVHRDGDLKGMGTFGKEWTKTEIEWVDALIERVGSEFKGFIRSARPGVTDDLMRGQPFIARWPEAKPLSDGIRFETLEDMLRAMGV